MTRSTLAQALLAALLTAGVYGAGLDVSPPYLLHDEIKFGLQAKSIADTGRDLNGRRFAVYFPEPGFSVGRDPLSIYATAALLEVVPLTETAIRWPSAIVGALGVGLVFVLARLLFAEPAAAWITAGLLAFTPIYFIHSRLALSVIYPVPFTVAWLVALVLYARRQHARYAVAAGFLLGAGIYSYLGAAVMMPLYLAMSLVFFGLRGRWQHAGLAAAAFVVMLLPLAWWQATEPGRYSEMLSAYRLYDTSSLGVVDGARQVVTGDGLIRRIDTYWDAFNPSRLYFTGESSLNISTREVGLFLLPLAVFLPLGLWMASAEVPGGLGQLLRVGFFTAPLPAVIMADVEIRRWLVLLPFAAVIATIGVRTLWRRGRIARAVTLLLLLGVPVQGAAFVHDYFGAYRERAAFWFGGNIRGALEAVIAPADGHQPTVVLLATEIPWVDAYWRFYTAALGRTDLLADTRYVSVHGESLPEPAPGAVLVAPARDLAASAGLERLGWHARDVVREADGAPAFVVFEGLP